jgi:hypothetical protein
MILNKQNNSTTILLLNNSIYYEFVATYEILHIFSVYCIIQSSVFFLFRQHRNVSEKKIRTLFLLYIYKDEL